jgi:hypothetical protein
VLKITGSEDLDKLRALAKLCSQEFFNDPSLLVAVLRRILEVLELAMPPPVEEKKVRGKKKKGKKKKKADPRKVEVFDACFALGRACNRVGDFEDARRYLKRAKEGYEEQLGPDSEKALEVTFSLIMFTGMSMGEVIDKLKALVERMIGVLGEENVVTLQTLNQRFQLVNYLPHTHTSEHDQTKSHLERLLTIRPQLLLVPLLGSPTVSPRILKITNPITRPP